MRRKYPICPTCQAYMLHHKREFLKCPTCGWTVKIALTWACGDDCTHSLNEACYEKLFKADTKRKRDD